MEGECLLEGDVEIMVRAVVIRGVETIAEITAKHKHPDVDSQSDSGAEREIPQKSLAAQFASGACRIILEKPDIAGIQEYGTVQDTDYREPVFGVQFQFECSCLVEIPVLHVCWRAVTSRSERPHGESP